MLTVVHFVLRCKVLNVDEGNMKVLVSDFLVADMPLFVAFESIPTGSTGLLDYVWARGLRELKSNTWSVAKLLRSNPHYSRWEFNRTMCKAVRCGDLVAVRWLLEHFPDYPILGNIVTEAAGNGRLEILKMFESERDVEWPSASLDKACEHGHWEVIRWWLDTRVDTLATRRANTSAIKKAVESNRIEEVKWLVARGFGVGDDANFRINDDNWEVRSQIVRLILEGGLDSSHHFFRHGLGEAAIAGDLEFVEWIALHHTPDTIEQRGLQYSLVCSLTGASFHGHLAVMQWLLTYVEALDIRNAPAEAFRAATRGGKLEVVRWLYERYAHDSGVDLFEKSKFVYLNNTLVCDTTAARGHLNVLSYLRQKAMETEGINQEEIRRHLRCTFRAVDAAATEGHLEVVKWLHVHLSAECSTEAMDGAAMMKWKGKHWPKKPYCYCGRPTKSFIKKQIEMLQYLKDNFSGGCTTKAMDGAAAKGHLKVLQWLKDNTDAGCTTSAMNTAAKVGRLDIVKWLHCNTEAGCTTNAMDEAAANGHLFIVKWLHTNRSEGCTSMALMYAALNGHLKVVKWICRNRPDTETGIKTAMRAAARNGRLDVIKWLGTKYPEKYPVDALTEATSCRINVEYTLPVVRWLLPKCTDVDLFKHIDGAMLAQRFDVALLLHSQPGNNDYNPEDVASLREHLRRETQYRPESRYMEAWLDEKYPSN